MTMKMLEEREVKLSLALLEQGIDAEVMADIHTTDLTDTTGDEIVRFCIDTDKNIYNIFVREVRFNNMQHNLYTYIAEEIAKCDKENKNYFQGFTFLAVREDVFKLECFATENVILDIEKARKIYNTIINSNINNLDNNEDFKKKFKSYIFKIGNIDVVNIINIFYLFA